MQKTILITGCSGQLGYNLCRNLSDYFNVIPTYKVHENKKNRLDLTDSNVPIPVWYDVQRCNDLPQNMFNYPKILKCSGHGKCSDYKDQNKPDICVCDSGYIGTNCDGN